MVEYIPTEYAIGDKFTFCGQSLEKIQRQLNDDSIQAAFYSLDENGNYTHLYVSHTKPYAVKHFKGYKLTYGKYSWHKVVLEELPVIIRKEKDYGLLAIFPTMPSDWNYNPTGYSDHDSFCSISWDYIYQDTISANEDETQEMLSKLRNIGYYNMKVYKRNQASFQDVMEKEYKRIKG